MKHLLIILSLGSAILISCGEKKQQPIVPETPAALQDNKTDLKSYGRDSKDLTEKLYAELVEQDPSLEKLEEDLNIYNTKPGLLNDMFENYNSKSVSYYASANHKAEMISDSVLKQKITAFITHSNNRYLNRTNTVNELVKQISDNNLNINDHHIALKVLLTMLLIEKYQSDNAINEKQFKDLIKEQKGLLKQIDKLIPEF
jgi:hypothetical protein